jgi:preprotein translocase subunit SecB
MDFTIELRSREAKLAEGLQARMRLRDVSLFECEAKGAGPPNTPVEPVSLTADLDSAVSLQTGDGIDFAVSLVVTCEDALIFQIEVTYLVRYCYFGRAKPASKMELAAFCKSSPAMAAWPYIRETVQSLATRMGFPTELLPLLRLIIG